MEPADVEDALSEVLEMSFRWACYVAVAEQGHQAHSARLLSAQVSDLLQTSILQVKASSRSAVMWIRAYHR